MDREDFYMVVAPIFATYLSVSSGNEALKYTSLNAVELNEEEARRLFVASLMPTPSTQFLEDKSEVVRLYGFALAQEEAGVDRGVVVSTFLESVKALAVAKVEARVRLFESITSALGALFLLPLFLLFLWSIGVFSVDPALILATIAATALAAGAAVALTSPQDLSPLRVYSWSILLGILVAAPLGLLASPPLSFAAFGVVALAWLKAGDRLWWFQIRREVPPMLRATAAMLKEGAPPDVILARLTAKFKTAAKVAYGYYIPSRYFVLAKSMYRAITEAGGVFAIKAVEYIQSIVDIEASAVRKMAKQAAAFFLLFTAAVLVLAFSVVTSVHALQESSAVNPFFTPPPYDEVREVLSKGLSLVTASYIAVFLISMGLHQAALIGGTAGLLVEQLLLQIL